MVFAQGKSDGSLNGYGNSAAPAAGVCEDPAFVSQDVHGKDPVLIKTAQASQPDHGVIGDAGDLLKVLIHVDIRYMTQVFSTPIFFPGREIYSEKIIKYQGLWRLGKFNTVICQRMLGGIENSAELFPKHNPSSRFKP